MLKNVPEPKQEVNTSGVKYVAVAFGVIGFFAIAVLAAVFVIVPNSQYGTAKDLYEAGNYEAAADTFACLGDYRDSEARYADCMEQMNEEKYEQAEAYYKDGDYEKALALFAEIGDYKDAKKRIEQIANMQAVDNEIYFGAYENSPIAWLILETQEDKMLLISKEPVVQMAFNDEVKNVTWETSSIREWLNDEFLTEFSDEQKNQIIQMAVDGLNNDDVFLLNAEDVAKYKGVNFKTSTDWWLRTKTDSGMMVVDGESGEINTTGESVVRAMGVRPCIWINIK